MPFVLRLLGERRLNAKLSLKDSLYRVPMQIHVCKQFFFLLETLYYSSNRVFLKILTEEGDRLKGRAN